MDRLTAAVIKEFSSLAKLSAANDGVVDKQDASVTDKWIDWDELHLCDKASL